MPLHVDEAKWPIVYLTYQGANSTDEMRSSMRFYQRMFLRGQRFCVVIDTRQAPPPQLNDMKVFSQFLKDSQADFKHFCAGIAFVMAGGLIMRMALRALMQLTNPPFPNVMCEDLAEADRWCTSQLKR